DRERRCVGRHPHPGARLRADRSVRGRSRRCGAHAARKARARLRIKANRQRMFSSPKAELGKLSWGDFNICRYFEVLGQGQVRVALGRVRYLTPLILAWLVLLLGAMLATLGAVELQREILLSAKGVHARGTVVDFELPRWRFPGALADLDLEVVRDPPIRVHV